MDPFFTELGQKVLARWKEVNFSQGLFPDIAREVLEDRPPATHVHVPTLIRDFLLEDRQPFQTQSGFGEPELVVYDDPRFYIQILFWLDGTTDIHQHKFSGAFHVLAGSSIHSRFEFAQPEPISAHLRVGQLQMTETQLLATGSTVPIISGSSQIHALFHLDTPSISVVVRTHSDPGTGPQFTYLPPHFAVDPFANDALTTRRKQLLDVLEKTDDPTYPTLVAEMLRELDFERGFFILQNGVGYLRSIGAWEESLQIFRQKHGRLAEFVAPTLEEIIRRDGLAELRRSITDAEHRFFLALLLNVPTRPAILSLVAQRFPGAPVDTIMRWIEELTETSDFGTSILDVELPAAQPPEVIFAALRSFIAATEAVAPAGSSPLSPTDLQGLREAFRHSSLRALIS